MRNHLRSLKGKFCIISIGENTLSVEYSDIYHVLSEKSLNQVSTQAFLLLPAKLLSVKIRKTRAPNFFHRIYSYEVVVTDDHFNNQKGVD